MCVFRPGFRCRSEVYLNGHEWLARKLSTHHLRYTKHDNVFLWIEDMARAQRFADRFANLNWPAILTKYAKRVNPQLQDILHGCQYYWVSAQSEYSTDILFKTRQDLCESAGRHSPNRSSCSFRYRHTVGSRRCYAA